MSIVLPNKFTQNRVGRNRSGRFNGAVATRSVSLSPAQVYGRNSFRSLSIVAESVSMASPHNIILVRIAVGLKPSMEFRD